MAARKTGRRRQTMPKQAKNDEIGVLPISRRSAEPAGDGSDSRQPDVGASTPESPIGDPDAVRDAIGAALGSLAVLEHHAQEVAEGFRWNQIKDANRGLADLVQSTQTLLALAGATARATGHEFEDLCGTGGQRPDEEIRLAVYRLIECEEGEDWMGLADTLDQSFVPALGQWRDIFGRIGDSLPPTPEQAA